MHHSEQLNELAAALAKAQAKIRNAEEDKSNPHYKSKYATLTSLWECCRAPLSENGLSIVQTFEESGTKLLVVTTLVHSSGQWIASSFPINQSIKIQETGSAVTYARRYSLSAIVGIAPGDNDDDDGEKAMERPKSVEKHVEKPETASKEDVDRLLDLVKQTPEDRQANFFKIIADRDWSSPYEMSPKFCSVQTSNAQLLLAKAKKEASNES
jgi:hypothetical protein